MKRSHTTVYDTLILLTAIALAAAVDCPRAVCAELTPEAKANRAAWARATQGENLAAGRRVHLLVTPDYYLTHDENDAFDLTDGKLTQRTDDRMWFDKTAVGWTVRPANLVLDLGSVQPIRNVVMRFLGGAEQGGLRFPQELELVVSEDGKTFYRAARQTLLASGDKDRDADPDVFFLPEEGKAYAYPIGFDNLRTKARYVGLRIRGQGTSVYADEMVVLKGEFPISSVSYDPKTRTRFIASGLAVEPRKDELVISTNITTPTFLHLIDARKAENSGKPITYLVEVPDQVTLISVSRGFPALAIKTPSSKAPSNTDGPIAGTSFTRDGRGWRRYAVTRPTVHYGSIVGPFYFAVSDPKTMDNAQAVFYAECVGEESHRTTVPIRTVAIPRVPKLTRHHVSLGWMEEAHALRWPDFFDAWEHLGFNAVSTFPRHWGGKVPAGMTEWLAEARRRGMKVVYNESPFHVMVDNHKAEREIYSQLDGRQSNNPCPSYRGRFYQEEIKRVGDCYELARPDYVFYDIELWYPGAKEAQQCQRCRDRLKQSGKKLDDFISDLGTEMIRDMKGEIASRAARLGLSAPPAGIYNVHAARPVYHCIFDFGKLYPACINFSQSELYVQGRALAVHDNIRSNYAATGARDNIPWLTAGTYGEFEPRKVEAMVLEAFLNGVRGITYYCFTDFDTPMDYYYHAKALSLLAPYERLLADGAPREATANDKLISVSAWGTPQAALVLVGNYQRAASAHGVTLRLPFEKVSLVRDVRTGKSIAAQPVLNVTVATTEPSLYYVEGQGQ